MATKETLTFESFIANVYPPYQQDLTALHEKLLAQGLTFKAEQAASGPVISYQLNKKTVFNFIFRKSGMLVRLYGENLHRYEGLLENLPESLNKAIIKASICKRLTATAPCNSRCPMGYTFHFQGQEVKKCRYNIILPVDDETLPIILNLVEQEIAARL